MGKDDQLADFERFKFDSDERWTSYLKSVEIPSNYPSVIRKLQAKWYKRTIDANFDLAWLASAKQTSADRFSAGGYTSGTNTSKPTETSSSNTSSGAQYSRAQPPPPPPPQSSAPTGTPLQQQRLFIFHAAVLALFVVHAIPVVPVLSARAFRWLMMLTALGQGYKVILKQGKPPVWPFSWQRLQMWLAYTVPTNDFYFALLGFAFFSQRAMTLAAVPMALLAAREVLQHMSAHMRGNFLWARFGERAHGYISRNQHQLQLISAGAEIGTWGMMILQLLTPARNLVMIFLLWNLLKLRYHVSESATYHQQAWRLVDQKTLGIRTRFPLLNTAVGYAQRWFMQVQR